MKNANADLLVDPPIKSKTQDRLNRAPLAEKVADMVLSYKGHESFVIGIEGDWGSGKTSFIEMMLEHINKTNKTNAPTVIKFNPWNFTNIDALYSDFFEQFGSCFGNKKKWINYGKKIFQRTNLDISFFGFSIGKSGVGTSLQELRNQIESDLKKLDNKIIIVVDDIDRLDKQETREVFKLVKLNANFPNVTYILAYARDKVEVILGDDFPGAEYLKKIVQVSFTLPQPPNHQLYAILGEELDKLLDAKPHKSVIDKYWDSKRWGNLAESGFKYIFKTIRDINRFVSSWRLDYLIIGYEEVNPIDFLGIEVIRVFVPQMYAAIRENKELFTKTDSLYPGARDDKDTRKKLFEEILSKAPLETRAHIQQVCRQIFPVVDGIYTNMTHGHDWAPKWRKNLQVCSEECFDTYFLLAIPTGKTSQVELEAILSTLSKPKKFAQNLKQIKQSSKLKAVFDGLMDRMDRFSEKEKISLMQSLFEVGDYLDDDRYASLADFDSPERKIRRLCYHALMGIKVDERTKVLKKLIQNPTSIYTPLFLGGYLVKEYEDHEKDNSKEAPLITNKNEIDELKKVMVTKIVSFSKRPEFKQYNQLGPMLMWWRLLAPTTADAIAYASGMLKSKSDLAHLIGAFKIHILSTTLGDYVSSRKEKIDTKGLDAMVGIDKIKSAIEKYRKGRLSNFQKANFGLFEQSLKGDD
ncbi:MAG: P-loop NTPase fold protein [Candidatus Gottesmanbacteria bacterium]|nr:P-loop NTPase fold protein [Candidatus Gottesmanbacteria bacterium]